MSTRSTIAIIKEDGSVKSIYCHWDGYIKKGVGETLVKHYNTDKRTDGLIALGSLSSLYKNPNPLPEVPEAHFRGEGKPRILTAKEHTFDDPQADVTVAYHRDRGEDLEISTFENLKSYEKSGYFQGYDYLRKDSNWYIRKCTYKDDKFVKAEWIELTKKAVKEDMETYVNLKK